MRRFSWTILSGKTNARTRLRVYDYTGSSSAVEDNISLRLDDRPPLDILFQTLDPPSVRRLKPKE